MKLSRANLFTTLSVALLSTATFAAFYPTHHVEKVYFSDAAKTQQVGHTIQWCSGRFSKYGNITEHFVQEETFPCNNNQEP